MCDTHPKPFHGPGCIYGDKLRYNICTGDILVQLKYQISHKWKKAWYFNKWLLDYFYHVSPALDMLSVINILYVLSCYVDGMGDSIYQELEKTR